MTRVDRYRAWIFDMDGTLTVPQHDFAHLRRQLGFTASEDILGTISAAEPIEQRRLLKIVADWEWEAADRAVIAPGAMDLLNRLSQMGVYLGILTRNRRDIALHTLEQVGLRTYFQDAFILGRDEAAPKPDPAGVAQLIEAWGECRPTMMVGDYIYDMKSGTGAGCDTILVGPELPNEWRPWVSFYASCLSDFSGELLLPEIPTSPGTL